jgi:hypothetical protein
MSLRIDLQKLTHRSPLEMGLFARAFFWLGVTQAAVAFLPFKTVIGWLHLRVGETAPPVSEAQAIQSAQVEWAIRAAAARAFWQPPCLSQALTGVILLQSRNIPGSLTLGVAKNLNTDEQYSAHAWLQCGGAMITGAAGRENFKAISTFIFN